MPQNVRKAMEELIGRGFDLHVPKIQPAFDLKPATKTTLNLANVKNLR